MLANEVLNEVRSYEVRSLRSKIIYSNDETTFQLSLGINDETKFSKPIWSFGSTLTKF